MKFTRKTNSSDFLSVPKNSWENHSQTTTPHGTISNNEDNSTSNKCSSQNISLVEITWVDACTHGGPGWVDLTEAQEFAERQPPVMRTVGYLIEYYEGPNGWIVVTDTMGDDECASVHKIPNVMIISLSLEPINENV